MEHHHGESWTIDHSIDTYQIDRWGDEFFSIGENGHIMVHPNPVQDIAWDLVEIVNQGLAQDLTPPVLIRLPGIIRARIQQLYEAFRAGREKYGYRGKYTLVFPIKVNQHQEVLDAVYASGAAVDGAVGMEAGSKAEMMAALCKADNQTPVFCNGFKDDTYIKPGTGGFMINLRVHDLDGFVAGLAAKGVEMLGSADEGYGKFAWLLDPNGVKIELWEQVVDAAP